MPCRQRPAGGFVAVVTKQIEAGRALTDIYPARFLHLVQKGGRHVQAADPAFRSFYLFPPFTVRAALHRHHAVHLHLRHRGRPVCLQLCGQDGLCGGQPHHAAAHAAGHHRLYAGHRRQRIVGITLGEGDQKKADRYFTLFLLAALISVSVLAVLGIVFLRPIAVLLGAKGELLDYAVRYGRILMVSLPTFALQNMFQSFFVTAEKPHLAFTSRWLPAAPTWCWMC